MNKENTRKKLLSVGSELMSLKGYNGVGLKEILDKASVPKGSFYYYFKSKEDFAIEVIKLNFRKKHRFLTESLGDRNHSPIQRLKNLIEVYRKMDYRNDSFLVKMMTEMANLNRPIRESLEHGMGESKKILFRCLSEARQAGEIGPSHDIPDLSEFIFSGWEGALVRSRLTGSNHSIDAFFRYLFEYVLV